MISFVFADLIMLPLLLIYRCYYGTPLTLRLLAVLWAIMSIAVLATEYLFRALGRVPAVHPQMIVMEGVTWNYTTILNIVALAVFAVLYWLYRNRVRLGGGNGYAKDPVCGMQVETTIAPATTLHRGQRLFFCSDHCQARFTTAPDRYTTAVGHLSITPAEPLTNRATHPPTNQRQTTRGNRPISDSAADRSPRHAIALGRDRLGHNRQQDDHSPRQWAWSRCRTGGSSQSPRYGGHAR